LRRLPAYFFFGSVSEDIGGVPDELELEPEPMLPLPEAEPPEVEPVDEPEALPLAPPLALPEAGGVTVTEPLVLLPGAVLAPGAELELLLELAGALGALGAVLEPLLDDEVPGRVASLDFGADDGPRSQPVAASAIATAAATSVR
jgi:hypothetical protein